MDHRTDSESDHDEQIANQNPVIPSLSQDGNPVSSKPALTLTFIMSKNGDWALQQNGNGGDETTVQNSDLEILTLVKSKNGDWALQKKKEDETITLVKSKNGDWALQKENGNGGDETNVQNLDLEILTLVKSKNGDWALQKKESESRGEKGGKRKRGDAGNDVISDDEDAINEVNDIIARTGCVTNMQSDFIPDNRHVALRNPIDNHHVALGNPIDNHHVALDNPIDEEQIDEVNEVKEIIDVDDVSDGNLPANPNLAKEWKTVLTKEQKGKGLMVDEDENSNLPILVRPQKEKKDKEKEKNDQPKKLKEALKKDNMAVINTKIESGLPSLNLSPIMILATLRDLIRKTVGIPLNASTLPTPALVHKRSVMKFPVSQNFQKADRSIF